MTVLETTAMENLTPAELAHHFQTKTFLREIKLQSFKDIRAEPETDRYGFWKKVLNKEKSVRDLPMTRLTRIKVEIGGWVNLPPGLQGSVSLLLEYEDATGKHRCVIDQMNAREATQVLLAGSADLQVQGKVRDMRVYCGGVSDRSVWIDNMHVKTSELDAAYLLEAS